MVKNPTTLGHHVMEAEVKDEPALRERSAEQPIAGASRESIAAFAQMQEQARDSEDDARSGESPSRAKRFLRRLMRRD